MSRIDDAKCTLVTRVCLVCLSVCLSVPRRIPTLLHGSGCNFGNGSGCPLVVHYWADLQSLHGPRCYDNIAQTRNISEYTCLYSFYAWFYNSGAATYVTMVWACNFSCRTILKDLTVTCSKSGNMAETVQDTDVFTSEH